MLAKFKTEWLIGIVVAILTFPFLSGVHLFDWDEINFAECAREMIVLKNYMRVHIGFWPFWEKPPLFFWLQAGAMHLFGVNEFAARFPNAVSGVVVCVLLYRIGKQLKGHKFGLLWALVYGGSLLPHFYFHSGIIDPWFNLFMFLGVYFMAQFHWRKSGMVSLPQSSWFYLVLAGLFASLAVFTKGPVGFLLVGLTMFVYWVRGGFRWYINIWETLVFIVISWLIMGIWLGAETLNNGPWFVTEFVTYQIRLLTTKDAGHGGFPGYHTVVLLLGVFPASAFALRGFWGKSTEDDPKTADFRRWMVILFWVVLVVFTIVKTKIVHYSSMAYFPISFMAAWAIWQLAHGKITYKKYIGGLQLFTGLLITVLMLALPLVGIFKDQLIPLINDPFAQGNLQANVRFSGLESMPAIIVLVATIWGYRLLLNRRFIHASWVLFGGVAVFVPLMLALVVGKIEGFSQRASVEFCKQQQGKDVYVEPVHWKSYVHYFYTDMQPDQKPLIENESDWEKYILAGKADKVGYLMIKIQDAHRYDTLPHLERLYDKNGFVFYKKMPDGIPAGKRFDGLQFKLGAGNKQH